MEITRSSHAAAADPAASSDPAATSTAPAGAPRLAPGVELIGEYEDSGFKEAPYLARRADGQVIQMSHLLFTVAQAVDGQRDYAGIAEAASSSFGKRMSAEQAQQLVEQKLRKLGVAAGADGRTTEGKRLDPMLALKFRAGLVPENVVGLLTGVFKPLFWPPVVLGVLGALAALDAYVFFIHGVAQGVRQMLYDPALMLLVLGMIVLSAAFHEVGHATACAYGGARPGKLGAGIYIVWPAFYSDVTDAYRLGKGGRLRTDLGGVYFNCVFMLATAAAYFWTHYEPLLIVIAIQHVEIVHQFLPFLRLDGYYVIADLTGVPDIFGRVKPVLRSLLPGRKEEKVEELKPWVRMAVTAWVLLMVPVVILLYGMLILNAPRVFATAFDSLSKQTAGAIAAASHGNYLLTFLDGLQALLLVLPALGLAYSGVTTVRRLGALVIQRTDGRPALRAGAFAAGAVIAGLLALAWLPHGRNYTPIRRTDIGTIAQGATTVLAAPASIGGAPVPAPAAAPAGAPANGQPATQGQPSAVPSSAPANPVTNPTPAATVAPSPGASPR